MQFDKDYYGILGLLPNAEAFLIKAAYKVLIQKYHPDKFDEPILRSEAEAKVKSINEAYAVLSDPKKRQQYDEFLKQTNRQNEYHENDSEESSVSDLINRIDWAMVVEYVPEVHEIYKDLEKISPILAFNFQLYVLKDKAFDKAKDVAVGLELAFFNTYFGNNRNITNFAKYLLKNDKRIVAQELNKTIKLFEYKIESSKIIDNLCTKYKIDYKSERPELKTGSNEDHSGFVKAWMIIFSLFFIFLLLYDLGVLTR